MSQPVLILIASLIFGATPAKADLALSGNTSSDPITFTESLEGPEGDTAWDWKILKTEWNADDERRFSEFVYAIGKSGCRTTDECMKSSANPYRETDVPGANFFSDCADLPYFMRAYFAWKNGLPFAYVSGVGMKDQPPVPAPSPTILPIPDPSPSPEPPRDIRYSTQGNYVVSRSSVYTRTSRDKIVRSNARFVLRNLSNTISSATYRIGPNNESASRPTDLYPVALTREALQPGSVIYDPAGHVALVYSVEPDGRILFIDAHPDNTLTRGTYGKKFVRSRPAHGAGLKEWRPIKIVGATQFTNPEDGSQEWVGGKSVAATNSELPHYSTVQFYGTNPVRGSWSRGKFIFNGQTLEYYDYLRHALAIGDLKYDPLKEYGLLLRALCGDINDRVTSVELAIQATIHQKPHPSRLPENIYGTTGEWEDYSTPSRDARLKTSFKEAYDRVLEFLDLWKSRSPSIIYSGNDLRGDLRKVLSSEAAACQFSYRKSDGSTQSLGLLDVNRRLFLISFDPYHCPERRWGATGNELASFGDNTDKAYWYKAERRLRNQIERTYDARMDYTAAELLGTGPGGRLGDTRPPMTDLETL